MFANKGTVPGTAVLNIFLSIYEDALTGILNLKRDEEVKIFYFIRGKLIWATSTAEKEKLENLLTSQGVVSGNLLDKVQEKVESPEAMGKFLLEKGLITLENLVNFTKRQLKLILSNSLLWQESSFEFIKGNPPETFPTLDLDITEFIINLILPDLKEDFIKKAVGSWQTPYAQNIDPDKTSKYNLSQSQKELLSHFSTGRSIENVISEFDNAHPLSLLKNIYFFLSCGLLVKKGSSMATESVAQDILKDIPEEIPADILDDDGAMLMDEPELPLEDEELSLEEPALPLAEADVPVPEPPAPEPAKAETEMPPAPAPDTPPAPEPKKEEPPPKESEASQPVKEPEPAVKEPELPLNEPSPEAAVPEPAPPPVEPVKPAEPAPPPPPVETTAPPPPPPEPPAEEKPVVPTDAEPVKPTPPPPVIQKSPTILDEPEPIDIPPPPQRQEERVQESEPQDLAYIFGKKKDDDEDLTPYKDETSSRKFLKDELPVEERKKGKQFNILLILISLALIISAVIFLVLPDDSSEQPLIQPKKKVTRTKTRRPRRRKPVVKKTDQKKEPKDIEVVMKPGGDQTDTQKASPDQKKPQPKADKTKPDTKTAIKKPARTSQKQIKKEKPPSTRPKTSPPTSPSQNPVTLFQQGQYQQAADIWKRQVKQNRITYSVLLELDCQTESVQHAYSQIAIKSNFFLLPRKLGARNCFLVLWGKFASKQEAENAIKGVPQYFWQQQNPPRVLELRPYL